MPKMHVEEVSRAVLESVAKIIGPQSAAAQVLDLADTLKKHGAGDDLFFVRAGDQLFVLDRATFKATPDEEPPDA